MLSDACDGWANFLPIFSPGWAEANPMKCKGTHSCSLSSSGSHRHTKDFKLCGGYATAAGLSICTYTSKQASLLSNPWHSTKSFSSYQRHFCQSSRICTKKWNISAKSSHLTMWKWQCAWSYLLQLIGDLLCFELINWQEMKKVRITAACVAFIKQTQRLPCWVFPH